MDEESRKIGMLIAAFDAEHARLQRAVEALGRSGGQLRVDVRDAAREAVTAALASLHPQIDKASQTLIDLQRLSLWRAAWQHIMVAIVAIAVTLGAVWWYVPPLSEITALRADRDQLQASVLDLSKQGGRLTLIGCGPQRLSEILCSEPVD